MTCKKKRLKCDETKPSCQQCHKRSVTCEGYKKDYKWRTFEETTFVSKPGAKSKRRYSSQHDIHANRLSGYGRAYLGDDGYDQAQEDYPLSPGLHSAFANAAFAFQSRSPPLPDYTERSLQHDEPLLTSPILYMPAADNMVRGPRFTYSDTVDPGSLTSTSITNTNSFMSQSDNGSAHSPSSIFSSGSPRLADLLLPGTDMNQPPDLSEPRPPMSPLPYQPSTLDLEQLADNDMKIGNTYPEDFDEEIIRHPLPELEGLDLNLLNFRQPSPAPSDSSSASSKSSQLTILAQPQMDASSAEMLMLRFDRQTCGILSVKDGPTENPWRTLIWPLAQESQALFHAISSMTAFHGAFEVPGLHIPGMAHMTKSIRKLASEMGNMKLESSLATSLALAFSEGWDQSVSTGIQHLKGARFMVNNAMIKHRQDLWIGHQNTQDAMRLKFLCNTFVYMDVIARLTSLEEACDLDFEDILRTVNSSFGDFVEVDPLMGCAMTLFPLIGRAANLIQKVRKAETNSLSIVSQAMELKEQLQQWQVPNIGEFERPEDPNSEVQHCIQTAEAYRYAMLLYLHQAVPEIPSDPAEIIAKRVLLLLASVPLSSRANIVQIFPLFVASCEVSIQEDRAWVTDRWNAMLTRLKIGNVVACWQIVQEVWHRRAEYEAEKTNRLLQRYNSRGISTRGFVPPMLNANKRKAYTTETFDEDAFFEDEQVLGGNSRPLKRRVTFDAFGSSTTSFASMSASASGASRRVSDSPSSEIGPEYTVRGQLHWVGVMRDLNWEGMSPNLIVAAIGLSLTSVVNSVSWLTC